jgi:hypothetical protein
MAHENSTVLSRMRRNMFTEPFSSSSRLFSLIKNLLPSNGFRPVVFHGRCLEMNVFSKLFASNG